MLLWSTLCMVRTRRAPRTKPAENSATPLLSRERERNTVNREHSTDYTVQGRCLVNGPERVLRRKQAMVFEKVPDRRVRRNRSTER